MKTFGRSRSGWRSISSFHGFTLIEIMIVVAVMGVIMAMSIPFARSALRKEGMNQAIRDITEVCANARARAIMQGSMAEVVFHGKDGTFDVSGGGGGQQPGGAVLSGKPGVPASGSGLSGHLPEDVAFAALKINGVNILNLSDAQEARVRFYPNGTCDELRLVLLRTATGESLGVILEITTGLATIESNPAKLAAEIR